MRMASEEDAKPAAVARSSRYLRRGSRPEGEPICMSGWGAVSRRTSAQQARNSSTGKSSSWGRELEKLMRPAGEGATAGGGVGGCGFARVEVSVCAGGEDAQ